MACDTLNTRGRYSSTGDNAIFFPEPPALHVVEHKQRNLTLFSAVIQHGDELPLTHEARTAPPSRPLPLYSS